MKRCDLCLFAYSEWVVDALLVGGGGEGEGSELKLIERPAVLETDLFLIILDFKFESKQSLFENYYLLDLKQKNLLLNNF